MSKEEGLRITKKGTEKGWGKGVETRSGFSALWRIQARYERLGEKDL